MPRRWLRRLYRSALMRQTGGQGLTATLPGGEIVRFLPEYRYLSWNPDEYTAFRGAVGSGDVALDIGANVGAYTLLLAQWVGPRGQVHAFEPSPEPFAGLERHIALNNLAGRVRAVHAAVTDTVGTVELAVATVAGQSHIATPGDRGAATTSVPATTVDAYCRDLGLTPAFIKIDVEGQELAVLRGARETIRAARRRLALFAELHPAVWPSLGVERDDLLAELRAQQLELAPLATGADVWAVDGICVRLTAR